jgi:hypothetical protein
MDQKKLQLLLAKEHHDQQQAVINAYTIVATGEAVYENNDNYYASLAKVNNEYNEHYLTVQSLADQSRTDLQDNQLNTFSAAANSENNVISNMSSLMAKQSRAIDTYTNIQKPVEESFFTLTA